jgi:hypothetical protein
MIDVITKIGLSGGLGALIGFFMIIWVEPTTTGGSLLLFFIGVVACVVVGEIISRIFGKRSSTNRSNSTDTP